MGPGARLIPKIRIVKTDRPSLLPAGPATKVDGIYDCDPKKNPNATLFDKITFSEALNRRLQVMDSTALSLCMDNNMPIIVFNMSEPNNIMKAICGESVGTLVTES